VAGTDRRAPRALLLWEGLPIAVQVAVVAPVSVVGMWLLHVTALNQPSGRGFGYGLFWGVIVAFVIVGATRVERAKREAAAERRARERDADPPGRMRL
jgi:hypothetical protein